MKRTRTPRWAALALLALGAVGAAYVAEGRSDTTAETTTGRPAVAVDVSIAATGDLAQTIDVVGALEPKLSADVKSELSGTVTAVYVTEWVPVRKGTHLARLDTSELDAAVDASKAAVVQAGVAEARARREHDRARQLEQYGLVTRQHVDEAKSLLEAAEAATGAARAQVRAVEARRQKCFLSAPMDGVVALRNVNVGDRVESMGGGEPLFRIVNNRLLDLTVSVPTSRLEVVAIGQPLEFTTDAVGGRTFRGQVMFINPSVDESSRSAKVIAEVPNADDALKGGLFVKGRILVAERAAVVQLPSDALQNRDVRRGRADVFVVKNGRAARRAVQTGIASGTLVEIRSGVERGEEVVTRGGFALRDGDRVKVSERTGSERLGTSGVEGRGSRVKGE